MLNNEYLIPEFIDLQSDYYIDYWKTNTDAVETASVDMNTLVASIVFNNHGVVIPFKYKLTDEQFALYEKINMMLLIRSRGIFLIIMYFSNNKDT